MQIRQAAQASFSRHLRDLRSRGPGEGGGDSGLVRCDHHVDVVDDPDDREVLRHFLEDYGDGLDFMQEMQRMSRDSDDDTRH